MFRNTLRFLGLLSLMAFGLACSDTEKTQDSEGTAIATHPQKDSMSVLAAHQVLVPEGMTAISKIEAQDAEGFARSIHGTRVLQTAHDAGEVTQLPVSQENLALTAGSESDTTQKEVEIIPTPVPDSPEDSEDSEVSEDVPSPSTCDTEQTCLSVCATASASAVAAAFAHASVTSCAFAEAWACVYDFNPFRMVCSWARSKACLTAFQSAFSYAFVSTFAAQCASTCSDINKNGI